MRCKSELYLKEQKCIISRLVRILDLDNKSNYTLYELDQDEEIQAQIMELVPEIRRWFSINNMKAVGEPGRIKRPWLSIIKTLIQPKFSIKSKGYHFKKNDEWLMTQQYVFRRNIWDEMTPMSSTL